MEANSEDADYHATTGHLLLLKHGRTDAPWDRIHASLDKALELNTRSERAHMYKAQALSAQAKHQSALEYFRKVVEINPKNTEAMREVRLATMRGKGKKGKGDTGLLSKFFGGKKKK